MLMLFLPLYPGCEALRPLSYRFVKHYYWPDMNPVIITAAASILATVSVMLLIRRIRHRFRTGFRLVELIEQNQYEYIILDVRTTAEYAASRIAGALNLPAGSIADRLPTEKMFEPIYVYGSSWRQARKAAKLLDATGYFNVTCYGAFRGWKGPRDSGHED